MIDISNSIKTHGPYNFLNWFFLVRRLNTSARQVPFFRWWNERTNEYVHNKYNNTYRIEYVELLHTHHTRINRKSKDNLLCLPRVCFGAQRGAAAFSIRNRGGNHSSSNSSSSDCPGPLSLFLSPFLFPPIASHPPREPIFIDQPPEGNKHTDCPLSLSLFSAISVFWKRVYVRVKGQKGTSASENAASGYMCERSLVLLWQLFEMATSWRPVLFLRYFFPFFFRRTGRETRVEALCFIQYLVSVVFYYFLNHCFKNFFFDFEFILILKLKKIQRRV